MIPRRAGRPFEKTTRNITQVKTLRLLTNPHERAAAPPRGSPHDGGWGRVLLQLSPRSSGSPFRILIREEAIGFFANDARQDLPGNEPSCPCSAQKSPARASQSAGSGAFRIVSRIA
jgi:hypothetical protein